MGKIGCELDDAIKSVNHEVYGIPDSGCSIEVKTVITLKNGYSTSESTLSLLLQKNIAFR